MLNKWSLKRVSSDESCKLEFLGHKDSELKEALEHLPHTNMFIFNIGDTSTHQYSKHL